MTPAVCPDQAPVPPPSYSRGRATALHVDALTLVRRLHLLALCRVAVHLAHEQCPPPLPTGPGGAPRVCSEESLLFLLSRANVHDAPFARPLMELATRLFHLRPRVIRLDAGYWGLKLIAWIHTTLGAAAVIPWNPKRQKRRDGLPPTWTAQELGKRTSTERFFGRVLVFFRLQRPPLFGWSAVETRVALIFAAVWVIALAAYQAGRPDLIRSPRLVLAHVWEGAEA
jgi:transposase